MDDLYGNLENYNEENSISELQAENKELKCKLEEYAATLNKLQKDILQDFDVLSTEYKTLETNYSSLLKTAKAEIERKTQIISNLNLEKDKMVLMSYQNRNNRSGQAIVRNNSPIPKNTMDMNTKSVGKDKHKNLLDSKKPSPCLPPERKDQDNLPSSDLRNKLLNLSNSGHQSDYRSERNTNSKENLMQENKDAESGMTRGSIKNRRKSMPALSIEKEQCSTDVDDIGGSASKYSKDDDYNFNDKQKHTDCERPKSRISETSSLKEREPGHYEIISDSRKQRSSRYDQESTDRYRVRHKSSHRYRRQSPDRYPSGPREFHDNHYHRSEPDKYRLRGRELESPPRDKYQRHSRERHRHYEKSHYQESNRMPHGSQERYGTKRRPEYSYDETDSKKARLEQQHKHHEIDRRMEDDNKVMEKKNIPDPLDIQFSSCESPDYDSLEVSHHQAREIKLIATMKLDDPRKSSHKYVLKNNNNKPTLYTVSGQNVDIVPLSRLAWGINPVSMPEALLKMPTTERSKPVDMCTENDDPVDVSMESGEIDDHEVVPSQKSLQDQNKSSIIISEPPLPPTLLKVGDPKDISKSLQVINNYKIPKLNQSAEHKHYSKDDSKSNKQSYVVSNKNKNKDLDNKKNIDVDKQLLRLAKGKKLNEGDKGEQKKQDVYNIKIPVAGNSEKRNPTAQEVVQGDLEMSDDNCDEDEQLDKIATEAAPISKEIAIDTTENVIKENPLSKVTTVVTDEPFKASITDSKKSKSKKKSKQKEYKCNKTENIETSTKKKEKDLTKSSNIKSKFCELFDDSSSMINPEDLGIASVPAITSRLPDNCVPFFEDAVDAADLNSIQPISENDEPLKEPTAKGTDSHHDLILDLCDPDNPGYDKKIASKTDAITDEDIESIYKNLEPDVSKHEGNVQTVVISTGVQPPVLLDAEDVVAGKPHLKEKLITQGIGLEALATSTPHKPWQLHAIPADADAKLPDTSCDSTNASQSTIIDNATVMDKSDNTMYSQIGDGNAPDVRIFVKRRRKVAKK